MRVKLLLVAAMAMSAAMAAAVQAASITYVGANFNTNTTLADGTAMVLVADEATAAAGTDPAEYYVTGGTVNNSGSAFANWGERTRATVTDGLVLVGPQNGSSPGDAPELRTRLSVANGTYNAYVYYYDNGSPWDIAAGFTSGSLTTYTGEPEIVAADFAAQVPIHDGGQRLRQAFLGTTTVTGGNLDIYVDDLVDAQRTWYDGVGFELIPEPTSLALFTLASLGCVIGRRRS